MKLSQLQQRVAQRRAESIFQMADKDGDGMISAEEYKNMHHVVQIQAKDETADKAALEREKSFAIKKAKSTGRMLKLSAVLGVVILVILGLSVVSNFVVISALLEVCYQLPASARSPHDDIVHNVRHSVVTGE